MQRRLSKLQSVQSMCVEPKKPRTALHQTRSQPNFNEKEQNEFILMTKGPTLPAKLIVKEEQESPTDVTEVLRNKNSSNSSDDSEATSPFPGLRP